MIVRIFQKESLETIIKTVERNLNQTVNRVLGITPFEIIFKYNSLDPAKTPLRINLESIHGRAKDFAEKEFSNRNTSRKEEKMFIVGEKVLVKNFNRSKVDDHWNGPFKI